MIVIPSLKKLKPISIGSAMADMALLLLVFFMASTSIDQPDAAELDLPRAKTESADQNTLYITIGKKEEIFFDKQRTSPDQLREILSARSDEKNKVVSIIADKNLSFKKISSVLKILQEQDFLNVVFISQTREE